MLLCFVLKRSSQQFSFANPCAKLPYRQRAVAVALYKPIPYIRCLPEFGSHRDCLRSINNEKLINRVEDVLNEQLAGLAKAYPSPHCIRTQCMSPAQMHR